MELTPRNYQHRLLMDIIRHIAKDCLSYMISPQGLIIAKLPGFEVHITEFQGISIYMWGDDASERLQFDNRVDYSEIVAIFQQQKGDPLRLGGKESS